MMEILIGIQENRRLLGMLILISISIFFGYLIVYSLTRFSSHFKKSET
ncbi:hypothetical protein [Leptospira stimsonii]|nr:hypothetical protein [Leptospira stimsonii]